MAQHVITLVEIDGVELQAVSSVSISQQLNWHHEFEVRARFQDVEGAVHSLLTETQKFIGKPIQVKIETAINVDSGAKKLLFKGVITKIGFDRDKGSIGNVLISGKSPTIYMDGNLNSKIFNRSKVKDIATSICGNYPEVRVNNNTNSTPAIGFLVQYGESDYHFLKRVYERYGDWMYYNGTELQFGLKTGNSETLTLGSNLSSLQLSSSVFPPHQNLIIRDYKSEQDQGKKISSKKPAGPEGNAISKKVLDGSVNFFDKNMAVPAFNFIKSENTQSENDSQAILDHKNEVHAADSTYVTGVSDNPALTIGTVVDIKGKNDDGSNFDYGQYLIVNVNHSSVGGSNYQNHFTAIPKSQVSPPPSHHLEEPNCDPMPAIVTDLQDPEKLGRVRVQFLWDEEGVSPWLRRTTPYAGGSRGFYFNPEIGDEVIVAFEQGDPDHPIILGSMYNGQAKFSDMYSGGNGVKAIRTIGGNEIKFVDSQDEHELVISNVAGDEPKNMIQMTFKDTGQIIMQTAGNLVLEAGGNIAMNAGANLDINVGANFSLNIGGASKTEVSGSHEINATGNSDIISGSDIKIQASGNIDAISTGSISATASANFGVTAGSNAEISAGANASMTGSAGAAVQTAGTAKIQGSLVTIN